MKKIITNWFTESDNVTHSLPKVLASIAFLLFIVITCRIYDTAINWMQYLIGWGVLIAGIFSMSRVAKEHIASIVKKAKSIKESI